MCIVHIGRKCGAAIQPVGPISGSFGCFVGTSLTPQSASAYWIVTSQYSGEQHESGTRQAVLHSGSVNSAISAYKTTNRSSAPKATNHFHRLPGLTGKVDTVSGPSTLPVPKSDHAVAIFHDLNIP